MEEKKELMIEIQHLSKSFGEVKAVQDLSFQIRKGELFAFLGVNGAGKSTTISILCGQLSMDCGKVTICGKTLPADRAALTRDLGVVFQQSVLDQKLTVKDNLKSRAAMYGIQKDAFDARLQELSQLLDFTDILDRCVEKLSGGQRRRIDIARALFHRPKILILDEPTTGLDPQTRRLLWNVIDTLRKEEQLTVLLTTHYMEETADSDYCIIIDSGKMAAQGTPLALKNAHTGDFVTIYGITEAQVQLLQQPYEKIRDAYRVAVKDTKTATDLILKYPKLFCDYEITKGKMDDVFLAVTGKKLDAGTSA